MKKFNIQSVFGYNVIQYLAAITGTLGVISCQMNYGWPSPSIPILTSGTYKITITSEEGSWLTVIPLFGSINGCVLLVFLNGKLGRKTVILLSALPLLLDWLIIGFARSVTVLYIARYVAGISDGICFSTVPLYLAEIADSRVRGMLSTICPMFVVFGVLLINALGIFLSINTTAFIATAFPLAQLISFIWMPESPTYLLLDNKSAKSKNALQLLRGTEGGNIEFERLSNAYKDQNNTNISFLGLFSTKMYRKTMFIILGLRTIQQLCGATAIAFYCKTILEETKDFISPNTSSLIYFSLQLVMVAVSSFFVDTYGRRPLILISTIGASVSLFLIGCFIFVKISPEVDTTGWDFLELIGLLTFIIFFSIGIQTIPYVIGGEIFSPEIKSVALSSTYLYNSAMGIFTSKFFHISNKNSATHVSFFFFGSCCIIGAIWSYFYVPETKGKTLEDIQNELRSEPWVVATSE